MKRKAFVILLLVAVRLTLVDTILAGDGECRRCHSGEGALRLGLKDVYKEIDSYRFQHPGVKERCEECHVERMLKEAAVKRWKAASFDYVEDQIFRIEELSGDREYMVEVRIVDRAGNRSSLPPYRVIPSEVETIPYGDSKPPTIRGVTVEEIRQGVFLEVVVRWETDEFSNSIVECGLSKKAMDRIGSEKVFTTIHRVRIPGLARGKLYHCRISSRDLFGNGATYEDFTIDTSKKAVEIRSTRGADRTPPKAGRLTFFRIGRGDDLYVRITANEDVKATLFVTETVEMDEHGFGLLPARKSQIEICMRCHPQTVSHPVGVRSRPPSTRIPPDLPTINGGVITCVTCHHPHGGNRRYFARMDINRDICVTCHVERSW